MDPEGDERRPLRHALPGVASHADRICAGQRKDIIVKRTLAIAAVSAVLSTGLVACGGDDSSSASGDYCDQLKNADSAFSALDGQDVSKLEDAVDAVKEFADSAPDSVRDDWKVLADTFAQLEKALADAGIKLSDLADIQAGNMPQGADMDKLMALGEQMQDLGGEEAQKAADAIEANAKSECDIDLGASS